MHLEDPRWELIAEEANGNIGSMLVVPENNKGFNAKQVQAQVGF